MRGFVLTVSLLAIMWSFAIAETVDIPKSEVIVEYTIEEEVIEEVEEDNEVEMSEFDFNCLLLKEECERRGMPYAMCLAISRLETGNFTSKAFREWNNWGGITRGTLCSYERSYMGLCDYLDCIEWYIEHGYTTPEEIGKHWCPDNPNWSYQVREIMEEIWD